jgi:clan AA aspartic protease (TIGR02281 family)
MVFSKILNNPNFKNVAMLNKKYFCTILNLVLMFTLAILGQARADILYFKNGRSIEGIIKSENENRIQLDIGVGTIGIKKNELKGIYKAGLDETLEIRKGFQQQIKENQERKSTYQAPQEPQKRSFEVATKMGHIIVDTLLNRKVKVTLMLDTGASLILLTKEAGRKLGIRTDEDKDVIQIQVADGRTTKARFVTLESVNVQGMEAKSVGAAVLLDDVKDVNFPDGLLGMSFLNNFNFRIDQEKKQLTLEKIKSSDSK